MIICPTCGEDLADTVRVCGCCRQAIPGWVTRSAVTAQRARAPRSPPLASALARLAHPIIALRVGGVGTALLIVGAYAALGLAVTYLVVCR